MNYKMVFAAMQAEMIKRKLSRIQIANLAHVNYSTLETWFNKCTKPERDYTFKSFLMLVDMLEINLNEFADHETQSGRLELLRLKNKLTCTALSKKQA